MGRARARMQDLMGRANALLMVSHNLNLLEQFCERGIWLHKGKIRMEGPVSQVTAAYRASVPAPAVIPGESPAAGTRNGNTNTNSEVIKVKDRDDVAEAQPEILFDPRDPMHVQPTQGLWERVTTCHCGGRVVPCAIAPWSICKRCRSWVNVHRLKKEALPRLLSLDPRPVGVYSPGISRYLSSNKEVDFEPLVSTLDFENKAIPRVKPGARIAHIGCGSGELLKLLENKSGDLAGFEEDAALAEQARGNTKAKIINGGSESFGTGEFDVIYCIDHLGRAHDVPDELARLKKALAPEGRLILVEPVFDDPAAPMHYPAALLSKLLYNYIFSIGAVHTQAHVAGFIETEEAGTWNNWPILILK
ncbi:MAG TPA: methyltransferase domain-containing protein [Phycisphaeraceae bacterium]|nr:methyltransferase domain-containing protein [Phycisphaeraceae bacterium]